MDLEPEVDYEPSPDVEPDCDNDSERETDWLHWASMNCYQMLSLDCDWLTETEALTDVEGSI